MGKPTVKSRYLLLIIILALFSAFIASKLVFRKGAPEKVTDTTVRARLLKARQNAGLAGFIGSSSNERYSSMVYDFVVERPVKSPLPWASSIPAGPAGRFEFTWRFRVDFEALFSLKSIDGEEDEGLLAKLTSAKGLPVYSGFMGQTLPAGSVTLTPGIYVLNLSSKKPLNSLEIAFAAAGVKSVGSTVTAGASMREINLKMGPRAMKDFTRLVTFGRGSTNTMIVKMPGARVKGEIFYDNKKIGVARVGLSGRSREHLTWFPSIDIKVSGGRSVMGMPSFKLYRLDTKAGVLELSALGIFQDMGFFIPRHELVLLKVNGETKGVYLLMETTTPAMFSNARKLEGDIAGVDLERLFFDYPYGAELQKRYFFKAAGTGYKRLKKGDFFSREFEKKINPQALAKYIAFTAVYLSGHGLGVDDLRFYMNPASGLFSPMPRDMSPVFLVPQVFYGQLFSHLGWLTNEPPYTVWPVKKLYRGNYKYERSKDVFSGADTDPTMLFLFDVHPAVVSFISESKNLALVNRYVRYFLSNGALLQKLMNRTLLASKEVLSAGGENKVVTRQRDFILSKGFTNLISAKDLISFLWDTPPAVKEGKDRFLWNKRTSPTQDEALSPALFEPMDLGGDNASYGDDMSMALGVEAKIFKILEENGFSSIKRSFRLAGKKEALKHGAVMKRKTINAFRDKFRAEKTLENVATYIMTRTDKGRAIVAFLVRNDTGQKGEYGIVTRDGLGGSNPVINKVFYAPGGKGAGKANMDDIFKNRFVAGERLRLLVFNPPLADKPIFYRLKVPENAFFIFPPFMYLPSRPSARMSNMRVEGPPPSWARKSSDGLHIRADSVVNVKKTITLEAGGGKGVFVEKGVTFKFAPGAGLIVKGDLHIKGTKERPVRFLSASTKPWGGLFAGIEGERIEVSVENAVFTNYGAYPKSTLGGLKLNGGLTILGGNVYMDNVEITKARGEDALNLIDSTALLRDLNVTGSFSDGIDMDFSDARIERLTMKNAGGDGLDVSNSLVFCTGSLFKGSTDKGISIGELSHVVVKGSKFIGNAIGIANKDQSFLRAEGSTFLKNGTAISEFIKKPWFGKPKIALEGNTFRANIKRHTWLGFHSY